MNKGGGKRCGGSEILLAGIQEGLHGVVLKLAFQDGEDVGALIS